MTKFKVGDVVTPSPLDEGFLHEHLVRGGKYTVVKCGELFVDVEGVFNYGDGNEWSVDWFELAEKQDTTSTAESLKETILSIRQERKQTLSKLKDLNTQEAEAVSQLNALGFSLFEEEKVNSSPSKTVLYAEDVEEDMTDPKNWKVGDKFVCLSWGTNSETYCAGDVCEMVGTEVGGWPKLKSPRGYVTSIALTNHFRFHSRPVK